MSSPFAFFISVFKVKDEDHLCTPIDDSSEEFLNQQLEHGIARGYRHNVSPLRNNSTHFDFQVQTKYKTVRAVCFSPHKRKVLNSFSKTDTPVKLKKCRLETKYNSEDLVLNDDVKIEACSEVDFKKKELTTNFKISTLKSISVGQLITIKAKVLAKSSTQEVRGRKLTLVEAQIIDHTGCIKIVLWEEFQNQVEEGKSLIFNNVRLKKNSSSRRQDHHNSNRTF